MATTFPVVAEQRDERAQLSEALRAARHHMLVVLVLLGLTAVAWWATVDRMAGMDAGPGTGLGTLGWFTGVWVVMMAAMMFPSLSPTVTMYARIAGTACSRVTPARAKTASILARFTPRANVTAIRPGSSHSLASMISDTYRSAPRYTVF